MIPGRRVSESSLARAPEEPVATPPRAPFGGDSSQGPDHGSSIERNVSKGGSDIPNAPKKSPRRGFGPSRSMLVCLCGLGLVASFGLAALLRSEQVATQAYSRRAERAPQFRIAGPKLRLQPWLDNSISAVEQAEEEHSQDQLNEESSDNDASGADAGLENAHNSLPNAQQMSKNDGKPRVALLFFGLSRSLMLTLPSIQEKIFKPLEDGGFNPTVFIHTYEDAMSADKRKSASSTAVEQEWKLLAPFQNITTSQAEFLNAAEADVQRCYAQGTMWVNFSERGQEENVRNLLCQLNSIKEVAALWRQHWEAHKEQYAAVAFIRPDVLYRDTFPVHLVPNIKEGQVWVPQWGNSKGGINDRFALLHPESAATWGRRLDYTTRHCRKTPIHAEVFCRDFAAAHGLKVKKLKKFVFFRVRANGSIGTSDKTLPGYQPTLDYIQRRQQELADGAAQELAQLAGG